MNQTKLFSSHQKLGAKFAPFAGWEMPIQYSSVKEEVLAVRENAGVFDVSHMGEFLVHGKDAVAFVDYIMTNDFANAAIGKAVYSPLCDQNAKMLDDFIAYKLAEDKVLLCVNASNIEKDFNWISSFKDKFDISLENQSTHYSLVALQGPNSAKILEEYLQTSFESLPYYGVMGHKNTIIARTGYTGEDGFEIFTPNSEVEALWSGLIELGAKPCGLAARDVLRLEVCFPLYGNELTQELTPLDCGLKWTLKKNDNPYIGKEAIKGHSPSYKLIKLSLDKGIPRTGYKVFAGDKEVGVITSGSMSVVLNKGIALARVSNQTASDANFSIEIRNKRYDAVFCKNAFVKGGHK